MDDTNEITEESELKYLNLCDAFVRLQKTLRAEPFIERLQKHTMSLYDDRGMMSDRAIEKAFKKLGSALKKAENRDRVFEFGDLCQEAFAFHDDMIDAIGKATMEISAETKPPPRESDQYRRPRLSHANSEHSVLSVTSRSEDSQYSEDYNDDFEEALSDDLEDTLDDDMASKVLPSSAPPSSKGRQQSSRSSSGSGNASSRVKSPSSSSSSTTRTSRADKQEKSREDNITVRASSARSEKRGSGSRPGSRKIGESDDRSWIEEDAWQLCNVIGRGTFGEVFMGLTHKRGQSFAVKRLSFAGHMEELKDWYNEVQLMSNLDHVNIVKYLGAKIDEANGCLNIFQEYMPHGSLESLLKKVKTGLNVETVRNYSRQMVEGLMYLHKKKIVHRDIKGGNVLVDDGGCVKLADFGASMEIKQDNTTKSKEITGTLFFMAPEVLQGKKYGRKGDVWALGCTMIQMITGEAPWKAEIGKVGLAQAMARLLTLTDKLEGPPPYRRNDDVHTLAFRDCMEYIFAKDEKNRPSALQLRHHNFLSNSLEDSMASSPDLLVMDDNSSGSMPHNLVRMHSDDSIDSRESGMNNNNGNGKLAAGFSFRKLENAARNAMSQNTFGGGLPDWAPGGSNSSTADHSTNGSSYRDTYGDIESRLPPQQQGGRKHSVGDPDANRLPVPSSSLQGSFKLQVQSNASLTRNNSTSSLGSDGSTSGAVNLEIEWKAPSDENPFARKGRGRKDSGKKSAPMRAGGGVAMRLGAPSQEHSHMPPRKPQHHSPSRMSREDMERMGTQLPGPRYDDSAYSRSESFGFQTHNTGLSSDPRDSTVDDNEQDTSAELMVVEPGNIFQDPSADQDSIDPDDRSELSGDFGNSSGGEEDLGGTGDASTDTDDAWNCAKCRTTNRSDDVMTGYGDYCSGCGQRRAAFTMRSPSNISQASTVRR